MKSERLELRVEPELKARVVAAAGERGQKVATFVERALESALRAADGMKAPESVLPHGGQSSSAPSRAPVSNFDRLQGAQPVPTVKPARALVRDTTAMERQARLNKARGS
jgi:hypothetical protein